MKTIDIQAKQWYDKVNGNSYFSAVVTLDFGTKKQKTFKLPFQYGYGEQYMQEARSLLEEQKIIKDLSYPMEGLYTYCQRKGIIYRGHKEENCLKKEVIRFGE